MASLTIKVNLEISVVDNETGEEVLHRDIEASQEGFGINAGNSQQASTIATNLPIPIGKNPDVTVPAGTNTNQATILFIQNRNEPDAALLKVAMTRPDATVQSIVLSPGDLMLVFSHMKERQENNIGFTQVAIDNGGSIYGTLVTFDYFLGA